MALSHVKDRVPVPSEDEQDVLTDDRMATLEEGISDGACGLSGGKPVFWEGLCVEDAVPAKNASAAITNYGLRPIEHTNNVDYFVRI